jgi:alanine-glyoxylate transaminase / serine-glyoxylate transaminase / serine-pyruvate transaminase
MTAPGNRTQGRRAGRHFLQIPGPSPVPDRIMAAMQKPVLDHRGPEFQKLGHRVLDGIKTIFQTKSPVVIYPASGTGAWEAALANTLSPGDHVLMYESGHFAALWKALATKLGLNAEIIASDWRHGVDANAIETRLKADTERRIKAVCVVHNETSTGATSRILDVRRAIDAAQHPALLMVDTISGLGSAEYCHDAWGVDVGIAGSQKGLMLPPGLSFNALSDKALAASKTSKMPKLFWSWEEMLPHNRNGFFHYTPATTLLYGLAEAIDMFHEEGMVAVLARHQRHAAATRACVAAWGLENFCTDARHYSPVLTTVVLPAGHDADRYRRIVLENFDMSLGTGLSKIAGKAFRIGHLGDINDLTLLGALSGCEMGLALAGVPHSKGGVAAAMAHLAETAPAKPA